MDIGQKLKEKRLQAGLTQEAVAKKIDVSRQTVSSWENNRSYPDIVSILRLSDLYEVSLDEFLKEDVNMRKHVEENAQTLKKIWNALAEIAGILLPVAIFMQHYNWDTAAVILYILSAVLYAVPRLFVPKLFGGSWKLELLDIAEWLLITGWMALGPYTWEKHHFWTFHFFILLPISLLSYYVWKQYKKAGNPIGARFRWTGMTLLLAVLLFIYIADSDNPGKQMDSNAYALFPDTYQVAEVIHGDAPEEEMPLVMLNQRTRQHKQDPITYKSENYLQLQLLDPETEKTLYACNLTELEVPAGVDSLTGVWQTIPEEQGGLYYQVTLEAAKTVMLSCYQDDSLQWKYRLRPTDRLRVFYKVGPNLLTVFESGYFDAQWFPNGESYDINSLSAIETLGKLSVTLTPNYPVETLTVYEDYYLDGNMTTRELTILPDENGIFYLAPAPYENGANRSCVYRVPFNDGEYVFRVTFPSLQDG